MIQATFKEWTLDTIDEAFGTKQVRHLPALDSLLAHSYICDDFEKRYINDLREQYFFGGDEWNEVELENKFISPLIVFAKIDNLQFAYFLERPLSAIVGEYELSGRVDGMIATGYRSPKKPFFCLAEYKRQTDPDGNPKAQTLVSLLAAQSLNGNAAQPVYGCYVIGNTWYFMVLEGTTYAISNGFFCTTDGIFDIFRILKGLRMAIENILDAQVK
ncbi:MAG: hypothetical protein EAZ92_14880 [Candidatus Kapaibacterium sp.]|nr:MAG: hypothetical protein EAZ92_14880 [Candidatus Kapabacteria bacterium]